MQQATETQIAAPLSVAQLAARVGSALRGLGEGWVEGEVTQVNLHRSSGHVYLTIADESASLDACVWKGRVERCLPLPTQGELVQAHYERVDFYAPRGSTKLIIDRLEPTGEGELLRRRAATLLRLRADGLCDPDRRKPLPAFPRRVGVIAARGDANVDVIQALRKRFPAQDIVFCAAAVQGVHAVGSVIDALGRLQSVAGVDVIVIARGGGSTADLVAFDDERLCRAIFACAKPVITSIGHTKDRPNCDHVAAAFAPVPAKVAELAIRHSAAEIVQELDRHCGQLARVLDRPRETVERLGALLGASKARVARKQADLLAALDRRSGEASRELRRRLALRAEALQADSARLHPSAARLLARQSERLRALGAVIDAKDFRRRGWVMVSDGNGRALGSVAELLADRRSRREPRMGHRSTIDGDRVALHFADGEAIASIEQINQGGSS